MGRVHLTVNDVMIVMMILFSTSSIVTQWDAFKNCQRPLNVWLAISFASILLFRGSHLLGQHLANDDDPLLGFDSPEDFLMAPATAPHSPPKWLAFISLGVLFPFFIVWTIIGTIWFQQVIDSTPHCLPEGSHPWFMLFWLVLCYIMAATYALFLALVAVYDRQVRQAEAELRLIENEDLLRRWGRLRYLADYGMPYVHRGLKADQIKRLPFQTVCVEEFPAFSDHGGCPICLEDFKVGDEVRALQGCGHCFHRSCVDLWLLRNANCPNCKHTVRTPHPSRKPSGVLESGGESTASPSREGEEEVRPLLQFNDDETLIESR